MSYKKALILGAEESFARRVVLAEIVTRPVKPLLQLIPGMFIFDFLKRTTEIKRYSQYFLFPRKLAMDLSLQIIDGEQKENTLLLAEEKIKEVDKFINKIHGKPTSKLAYDTSFIWDEND